MAKRREWRRHIILQPKVDLVIVRLVPSEMALSDEKFLRRFYQKDMRAVLVSADWAQRQPRDPYPSEILPGLYLGDAGHARDITMLEALQIKCIVNVTREQSNLYPDHFVYHRIRVRDCLTTQLAPYFQEAADFIETHLQAGEAVLVHCMAGVSRSATIILAYLILKREMDLTAAIRFVQEKRPVIKPNESFVNQLITLNLATIPRVDSI